MLVFIPQVLIIDTEPTPVVEKTFNVSRFALWENKTRITYSTSELFDYLITN